MKLYYEKCYDHIELEAGFILLEINGKRIQITDDDGMFEVWTDPDINSLLVRPLTSNKVYLEVEEKSSNVRTR